MKSDDERQIFHASCDARASSVEAMILRFREFVSSRTEKRQAFDAELVAREALINAAEHGCGYAAEKSVSLDSSFDGQHALELTICHDGNGFDIDDESDRPMQDLAENGRGLFIIRSLSASAVWSREGRMLRVTLRQDIQEEEKMQMENSTYAPSEDLTAATIEQCRSCIMKLIQATNGKFTIDLSKVHMVDSKGIGLIIASYNTLQTSSRELEITGSNDEIRSLFKLMRLDRHFVVS